MTKWSDSDTMSRQQLLHQILDETFRYTLRCTEVLVLSHDGWQ